MLDYYKRLFLSQFILYMGGGGSDSSVINRIIESQREAKVEANRMGGFNRIRMRVQNLGERLEDFRGKATGDLGVTLGELEAEQAQLMAELEAIGGENEKWDAARKELIRESHDLRGRVNEFAGKVNG